MGIDALRNRVLTMKGYLDVVPQTRALLPCGHGDAGPGHAH